MAFPIPVYHEHSHICTDIATVLGARKASAFLPSTVSSYQANCDTKGWYGVYTIGDTAYPIGEQRPGISKFLVREVAEQFSHEKEVVDQVLRD